HSAAFNFALGRSPNYDLAVSEPFIIWPGSFQYTIDLASLGIGADQGILPTDGGSPTASRWIDGSIRQLRIDPHEFAEQLTTHLSNVRLTAIDTLNTSGHYSVGFAASDADGDPITVRLWRDRDTIFGNGNEVEITPSPVTGGVFDWNPAATNTPPGLYNIYAL